MQLSKSTFKAQGTIEYLVVLAVVVVVSLVIVGLITNLFSSPSQQIDSSSAKVGEIATGGISVVESAVDSNGNSLLTLSNNSSDMVTLTKISTGDVDNNYAEQIIGLDSKTFSLSGLTEACPCSEGQTKVKCEFKIEYTSAEGIVKTEYRTVNADCVDDSSATEPNSVVDPIDLSLSVITLSSPSGNVSNRAVDFVFDLTKSNKIDSCTLHAGNDSNTYRGFISGSNTIRYTFSSDILTDWNISCIDNKSNVISSNSLNINVDSNDYQITTCLELQDMNQNLSGNYELMNDIDCGYDTNNASGALWNGGAGFEPIGSGSNNFTGSFNGKRHKITGLYINRVYYVGLFGVADNGRISNVGLEESSINGDSYVGGIVGVANNSTLIINSYNTGSITAAGEDGVGVGGIAGDMYSYSSVVNCYNTGDITGYTDVGGIAAGMDRYSIVKNSYNLGSVTSSGGNSVGGVAGSLEYYCSVINSYNAGSVSRVNSLGVGGIIGYADSDEHDTVINSFSVGELPVDGYSGGVGRYCSLGVITNSFWFGEISSCCGSAGGTCTKETTLSNFYSSTHGVYTSSPAWNDGNWVWTGNSLPTLSWQ